MRIVSVIRVIQEPPNGVNPYGPASMSVRLGGYRFLELERQDHCREPANGKYVINSLLRRRSVVPVIQISSYLLRQEAHHVHKHIHQKSQGRTRNALLFIDKF